MPMIDVYAAEGTFDDPHGHAHTNAELVAAARAQLAKRQGTA